MKATLTIFCSLLLATVFGQTLEEAVERNREGNSVRVVFYNVENLFDTIADANIADEEFLPTAVKAWDTKKYRIKVANTAKTIRAVGGWQAPEIVGLAEIENRSVLLSLANHTALKAANYAVLHFDSPDPRGIDVALLYNQNSVEVLFASPIKVRLENSRTRDVLYAKVLVAQKDTLHLFVNHWSSRSGGQQESEPKRVAAAKTVKHVTDSILSTQKNANILVMGDFNDSPKDASLQILSNTNNAQPFTNLMSALPATSGSHKYKGVWDYLDQILVSGAVLQGKSGLALVNKSAYVFSQDFLVEADDRYGDVYPKRTWKGDMFVGGYSDHLPVFCDLSFKK